MVNIIQDFIPVGANNRPGYAMTPLYITVHNTANTAVGADAAAHARYLKILIRRQAGILQLMIQKFISICL